MTYGEHALHIIIRRMFVDQHISVRSLKVWMSPYGVHYIAVQKARDEDFEVVRPFHVNRWMEANTIHIWADLTSHE